MNKNEIHADADGTTWAVEENTMEHYVGTISNGAIFLEEEMGVFNSSFALYPEDLRKIADIIEQQQTLNTQEND